MQASSRDADDPRRWLGPSPFFDLDHPRLRLRVRSLTQLHPGERERALALYGFVKRMPMTRSVKIAERTAPDVLAAGHGDPSDKATLLVAMLRIARLPARIRVFALRGEILRGLAPRLPYAMRPVVEVWLQGKWQCTDTHIFDPPYMAAARHRLKEKGWEWGYGIHVAGEMVWDGHQSAYAAGPPTPDNPMLVADLGVYQDPLAFFSSPAFRDHHNKLGRAMRWNLIAPAMQRAIERVRKDAPRR